MILCIGLLFAALTESGIVKLDDITDKLDFTAFHDEGSVPPSPNVPEEAKRFSVNVLDVGQGDSILVLADGHSLLIDAGEAEYSDEVISFLKASGVEHLDYIIGTHPHSDHIGGMAKIIRSVGADKIIVPKLPDSMVPTTVTYEKFLNAVKDSGGKLTAAKAGKVYELAEIDGKKVTITILTPVEGKVYDDLNNYSVSARIDYGSISWLFTGDLSEDGEKDLVESGADIDTTAYKVAHHGSSGASCSSFLKEVTPSMAVISCGKDNSYGHPTDAALTRIEKYTDRIYRTDLLGTISVYSDGKKLYITHNKEGSDS